MPATTMTAAPPAQARAAEGAPAMLVPFIRGSVEHVESMLDQTVPFGASTVPVGPVDVPAYGFMRNVWVEVTATGGAGAAVFAADAPWSILDALTLSDVNGQGIYGPVSGYESYLTTKYGGYRRGVTDPRQLTDFASSTTGGTFRALFLVPVEIVPRDGLGALANVNAASSYKLRLDVAPSSRVYTTAPTTLPAVRVRAWLDAYAQPDDVDLRGNPIATYPPAHGTTQFWSKQVFNFAAAGFQSPRLSRVGNYLRELIFVWRDSTGARVSSSFAAPLDLLWDTRLLTSMQPELWRAFMAHRFGYKGAAETPGALDTGVFVHDYCHEFDGLAGYELRDGWLPTTPSTRLDVTGTFGSAGTLTVLTNDVSPAGEVFV